MHKTFGEFLQKTDPLLYEKVTEFSSDYFAGKPARYNPNKFSDEKLDKSKMTVDDRSDYWTEKCEDAKEDIIQALRGYAEIIDDRYERQCFNMIFKKVESMLEGLICKYRPAGQKVDPRAFASLTKESVESMSARAKKLFEKMKQEFLQVLQNITQQSEVDSDADVFKIKVKIAKYLYDKVSKMKLNI